MDATPETTEKPETVSSLKNESNCTSTTSVHEPIDNDQSSSLANSEIQLHKVIEDLSAALTEKNNQIIAMETQLLNEYKRAQEYESFEKLQMELNEVQLKHSRLSEAHKKLQKVNLSLEEKLFKLVDRMADEKKVFQNDMSVLNEKLVASTNLVRTLQEENEKCKNEISIAVQLLKCKPVNSIAQKHAVKQLPKNVQETIRYSLNQKKILSNNTNFNSNNNNNNGRNQNSKVPIITYPPTAMVYSMSKLSLDNQSDENSEISVNDLVRLLDNELKLNNGNGSATDETTRCECCCNCNASETDTKTVAVQTSESESQTLPSSSSSSAAIVSDSVRKSYKRFRSNDSLNAAKMSPESMM